MNYTDSRIDIQALTPQSLTDWLKRQGIRSFRAGQILRWIYLRQVDSFEQMTDLSRATRCKLERHFRIDRLEMERVEVSVDGTRKFLFRLSDGEHIESVLIPERSHHTLCISSQVGCAQGCRFCLTARRGFIRNLRREEIVSQVRDIQHRMPTSGRLTNIVFMGMGEPLANYNAVVSAIGTMVDNQMGMRFASRRITLSTAGLIPRIPDLGRDTQVNVAISLNAVDNDTRSRLMPINRKYPIETLLDVCRQYPLRSGRRITVEYILIKDVNDAPQQATALAALLRPLRAKINLIPFNPHDSCEFQEPSQAAIQVFQEILLTQNFTTIVRHSKGADISAACGQLQARAAEQGPVPGTYQIERDS